MEPLLIQVKKFEYKNTNAPEKLIHYITRTREYEDRQNELLLYGGPSGYTYQIPVDEVIKQFKYVQKFYGAKGSLMCHYVIHISQEAYQRMNNNICILGNYATECCQYLAQMGHQSCFAIHNSPKDRLHIHLAINTTNYTTGYKLRQYHTEVKKNIEYPLSKLLEKYTYTHVDFVGIDSSDLDCI